MLFHTKRFLLGASILGGVGAFLFYVDREAILIGMWIMAACGCAYSIGTLILWHKPNAKRDGDGR